MDQTGTFTYKASQVIAKYLSPLTKNGFKFKDTLDFADMLKAEFSLSKNEEYFLYDVESLFTNIPLNDTINYILDQVYNKNDFQSYVLRLSFVDFC